jgi:peptidyl-tRNA hydrolase
MKPVMYSFLNRGLGMSTGKAAAQAQHAAVEAYRASSPRMIEAWYLGGHYTKMVMLADDAEQLTTIQQYIEERGFKSKLIIDEGRTEIPPFSKTALGVEIVDKSDVHVLATFGEFKLYPKDESAAPLQNIDWMKAAESLLAFGSKNFK